MRPLFSAGSVGQVVAYLAAVGGAVIVSPQGEVLLAEGAIHELDLRIIADRCRGTRELRQFPAQGMCVHALPIVAGWILCALTPLRSAMPERDVRARLERAANLLIPVLAGFPSWGRADGSSGSGPDGAPAEIAIGGVAPKTRRN